MAATPADVRKQKNHYNYVHFTQIVLIFGVVVAERHLQHILILQDLCLKG